MHKKTAITLGFLALIIIILAVIFSGTKDGSKGEVTPSETEQTASLIGCYVATNEFNDVYTLNIQSVEGTVVSGLLSFRNYQKDSSRGTFAGTFDDGVLVAEYSFASEGMDSVMQVAFKKAGDDFIRGYGDLTNEGTRFANVAELTYDPTGTMSVFKKAPCDTAS